MISSYKFTNPKKTNKEKIIDLWNYFYHEILNKGVKQTQTTMKQLDWNQLGSTVYGELTATKNRVISLDMSRATSTYYNIKRAIWERTNETYQLSSKIKRKAKKSVKEFNYFN